MNKIKKNKLKKAMAIATILTGMGISVLSAENILEKIKYDEIVDDLADGYFDNESYKKIDGKKLSEYLIENDIPYIKVGKNYYTKYGMILLTAEIATKVTKDDNQPEILVVSDIDNKFNYYQKAHYDRSESDSLSHDISHSVYKISYPLLDDIELPIGSRLHDGNGHTKMTASYTYEDLSKLTIEYSKEKRCYITEPKSDKTLSLK